MPSESGSGPSPSIQPQLPSPSSRADFEDSGQPQLRHEHEKPVVTSTIRARIVKALATIKGKRGSPFSFVTSGDSPSFSTKEDTNNEMQRDVSSSWQDSTSVRLQATPVSLKLSRILRPLTNSVNNDDDWRPAGSVTMPSYVSSMTMGQTITDPIAGGIVSPRASKCPIRVFHAAHECQMGVYPRPMLGHPRQRSKAKRIIVYVHIILRIQVLQFYRW